MSARAAEISSNLYRRLWDVLTRWFKVPAEPPTLPPRPGEEVRSFRPAEGFLRYLKFQFWILLAIVDLAILIGWLVITAVEPVAGVILAPIAFLLAVVPDLVAYVAIHLRYDTTWYVMSDRSVRIRRGIWVITETTLTFENVQNVAVKQGPLQRWYGIGDVHVETAGGGSSEAHGGAASSMHRGLIEGVANAKEIRDLILSRLHRSRSAGLGDEVTRERPAASGWSPQHIAALKEIRDELRMDADAPSRLC